MNWHIYPKEKPKDKAECIVSLYGCFCNTVNIGVYESSKEGFYSKNNNCKIDNVTAWAYCEEQTKEK